MAAEISPDWLRLRRSLQSADGFAVYFVFTDAPKQNQLGLDYLSDSVKLRTQRLQVVRPSTAERLVEDTLAALFNQPHHAQPVWLECWRDATNADWNGARRQLLARLNEGRGRLESSFAAPLILLLPYESAKITAETAPDLWSVRRRTLYLHQTAPEVVERPVETAPSTVVSPELAARAQRRLETWNRQWATYLRDPQTNISINDAFGAFDVLIECGRIRDAQLLAQQTLTLAYERFDLHKDEAGHESLRDLSISLDNVGQVSRDLGELETARAAYAESLDLFRKLHSALGDTPQTLRDLSVSLNNLAVVSNNLGDSETAQALFTERDNLA